MIMELKRKLKKIVNSISIFLIVGCSYYSMAGSIPANINNVYIPLIENDTAEFEISENLTSKITQEIAIQNILKITDNSNSDSTILGVITSATDGPFTFDSNEQVDEYRFSISLKILWVDNENENLIKGKMIGAFNTKDLEKEMIIRTLEHFNNNRRAAAKSLDMSERTLYRKINDYGIEKKIKKDS